MIVAVNKDEITADVAARLVAATLRRISDEARNLASAPCVLPHAAVSRRP